MDARGARAAPLLAVLLLLLVTVGRDALRLGFYADDFIFLDAARHAPAGEYALGHHGIRPWYRPLARELYFAAIVAAGPAALLVARALSLAALLVSALALRHLGRRLFGEGAAVAAPALFLVAVVPKFLALWASGFQDLLALALLLAALVARDRGADRWTVLAVALAPLAKESGFLAAPLVFLHAWVVQGVRRLERWMFAVAVAAAAAALVHVLARATWPVAPSPASAPVGAGSAAILGRELLAFLGDLHAPAWPATLAGAGAALAAAAAVVLLGRAGRAREKPAPRRAAWTFAALATLAGVVPVVVGHLAGVTRAQAYQAVPALPGLVLLAGGIAALVPRSPRTLLLAVAVASGTAGASVRPVDLDVVSGWSPARLGFAGAQRIDARTKRLAGDLRRLLAERPESLVVLYAALPAGAWFQTEDGPATREILGDRTVRAAYLSEAPRDLDPERLALLRYDPVHSFHLEPVPGDEARLVAEAVQALLKGEAAAARALLLAAPPAARERADLAYLRAVAALVETGPEGFLGALRRMGAGDSSATSARRAGARLAGEGDGGLSKAMGDMMAAPRSAASHVALGDTLLQRGVEGPAGVEWRAALALDPRHAGAAFRLGDLFARAGKLELAAATYRDLEAAAAASRPALAAEARRARDALRSR